MKVLMPSRFVSDSPELRLQIIQGVKNIFIRWEMNYPINCAFLIGSPDISGGNYVIFEHAIRMAKRGNSVAMITDSKVSADKLYWHPEARVLNWITYEQARYNEYDIVIATWWATVFKLLQIQARIYAYFIQSIESRFYPENDIYRRKLVDGTYSLPVKIITEASWIKKYLMEKYQQDAELVLNGIRKDIYNNLVPADASREKNKLRILIEGPIEVPFKNVARTIEICRQSKADEIWLLTLSEITEYPGVDRVFSRIPIFETPKVYRSCDLLVKLSFVEGMFGPPLEMFHCGGTAIVYNVTGHEEYMVNNYNGIIIKKNEEGAVIKSINNLKDNPDYLETLKKGAFDSASKWPDWEIESKLFEKTIQTFIEESTDQNKTPELETKGFVNRFKIEKTFNAIFKEISAAPNREDFIKDFFSQEWIREQVEQLNKIISQCEVYLFGTGSYSDFVYRYLDKTKVQIKGYFDNNPKAIGLMKNNLLIEKPGYINGVKIIIASGRKVEIANQLRELGYKSESIIRLE